jgi:hypothetical protein
LWELPEIPEYEAYFSGFSKNWGKVKKIAKLIKISYLTENCLFKKKNNALDQKTAFKPSVD